MTYALVKWLHILSAVAMFGAGIAFVVLKLRQGGNRDAGFAVRLDRGILATELLLVAPAVAVQVATGWWLGRQAGLPVDTPWLFRGIALFGLAGVCWLAGVWLETRMLQLARAALARQAALPGEYRRARTTWLWLHAAIAVITVVVFWLMTLKPLP